MNDRSATASFRGYVNQILYLLDEVLNNYTDVEKVIYEGNEPFCEDITIKLNNGKYVPIQTKYVKSTNHLGDKDGLIKVLENALEYILNEGFDFDKIEEIIYISSYSDGKLHNARKTNYFFPKEDRTDELFDEFENHVGNKFDNALVRKTDYRKTLKMVWKRITFKEDKKTVDERFKSLCKYLDDVHKDRKEKTIFKEDGAYAILGQHIIHQMNGTWVNWKDILEDIEKKSKMDIVELLTKLLEKQETCIRKDSFDTSLIAFKLLKDDLKTVKIFENICRVIQRVRDDNDVTEEERNYILKEFRKFINSTQYNLLNKTTDYDVLRASDNLIRRCSYLSKAHGRRGDLLIPKNKFYRAQIEKCLPYMY